MNNAQEAELREIAAHAYHHGLVQFAACERLGRHYFSTGQAEAAARFYKRLAKAPKTFRTARFLSDYAELCRRRGDRQRCVQLLEEVSKRRDAVLFNIDAGLARAYGEWGKDLTKAKKWGAALAKFEKAHEHGPFAYWAEHVDACLRTRRFQRARDLLGDALVATGDEQTKPTTLPDAATLCKKIAGVCITWAQWLERRGRFKRAADLYKEAKEFDDNARPCLTAKEAAAVDEEGARPILDEALRYMEVKKNYRAAFRRFQAVVVNFPQTDAAVEAEFHVALCYWWLRKWPDSRNAFRAFYKRHPDHKLAPRAWLFEARVLTSMHRFEEAIEECDGLVAEYRSTIYASEAMFYKGYIQGACLGDEKAAIETLDLLATWYPDTVCGRDRAPKLIELIQQGQAPWKGHKPPKAIPKRKGRRRAK